MKKMKGGASLNYSSFAAQFKMMFQTPESNRITKEFGSAEILNDRTPLRTYAEKKGLYIGTIADTGLKNPDLTKVVPSEFNSITAGNAFKWGNMSKNQRFDEYEFEESDRIAGFAKKNDVRLRGHVLLWGRTPGGGYPLALDTLIEKSKTPKEDLLSIMKSHIHTVVKRYDDTIKNWDVVNEPYEVFGSNLAPYTFQEVLGKDYIKKAFYYAKEASTYQKLILNEQFFYYQDKRALAFLDLVEEMVGEGVPIDGIGLQHHVMFNEQSSDDLKRFIERINRLGLTYEITELDVRQKVFKRSKNMALAQAQSYYTIARTCIESGGCEGITLWGVGDGVNWYDHMAPFNSKMFQPNKPLLFNEQMNKKPAYYGLREALKL